MKKLKSRPAELEGLKPCVAKRAKDYVYTRVEFFIKDDSLYIKFTGYKEKAMWFALENFRNYTALEAAKMIIGGRHFESGILEVWKNEQLEFGGMKGRLLRGEGK